MYVGGLPFSRKAQSIRGGYVAPPLVYRRGSAPSEIPKTAGLRCRRRRALLIRRPAVGALYSFDDLVSKLLNLLGADA